MDSAFNKNEPIVLSISDDLTYIGGDYFHVDHLQKWDTDDEIITICINGWPAVDVHTGPLKKGWRFTKNVNLMKSLK